MPLEGIDVRRPVLPELREPFVELLEGGRLQPIQAALAVDGGFDEAGVTQHAQVFGHGRLGHVELSLERPDGELRCRQQAEYRPAIRLRDDFEDGFHAGIYARRYMPVKAYIPWRFAERPIEAVQWLVRWSPKGSGGSYVDIVMRIPFSELTGAELAVGAIRLTVGGLVALIVYRGVARVQWPRPMRFPFILLHVLAGPLAAAVWLSVSSWLEFLIAPAGTDLVGSARVQEFMTIGTFVYVPIAMASYAAQGTARLAHAEAVAARTQLAALRAQLHPHFLFNALHSIVQLIPADPRRAAEAAELIGDLLRTALEEQRDEIPLADEWRFVSRYLDVERIRFGDRLIVRRELPVDLLGEHVPSFALQTLVENAVLHGAAPRVAPTEILITAAARPFELTLTVRNSGDGASATTGTERVGTGLSRLRERLTVLYGRPATLTYGPMAGGGYEASLVVPRRRLEPGD